VKKIHYHHGDLVADLDYLSPVGKSDHCVLSFHCAVTVENVDNTHKYSYNKGNYEKNLDPL